VSKINPRLLARAGGKQVGRRTVSNALVRAVTAGAAQGSKWGRQDGMPCGSRSNPYSKVFRGGKCMPNAGDMSTVSPGLQPSPAIGATDAAVKAVQAGFAVQGGRGSADRLQTDLISSQLQVEAGPAAPSATPQITAPAAEALAVESLATSGAASPRPVGKAGGGAGIAIGAVAGFLLAGPLGAAAGAALFGMGKSRPKVGSPEEASLAAAQAASVRAAQIDRVEQTAAESTRQLQGLLLSDVR